MENVDISTLIAAYLEAKADIARSELVKVLRFEQLGDDPWITGMIQYYRYKVSIINELVKDTADAEARISQHRKRLLKRRYKT